MSQIEMGNRIQIHYQTRSKQGNMIETSEHREPFEFTVGDPAVISGLSQAVIGLQLGERKHVILSPDLAFGYRDPRLQQSAPRVGSLATAEEGDQLSVTTAGQTLDIWVRSVHEHEIALDANHPLAGESIVLDLEVVGIIEASSDDSRVNRAAVSQLS